MEDVALAYLHPGHVQHSFMASVLRTMRTHPGLEIWPLKTGVNSISRSRNLAATMLLAGEREWLWFVDTDIGFAPTMLAGLRAIADRGQRPVVAAPYLAVIDGDDDELGGFEPQIHPAVYEFTGPEEARSWPLPLPDQELIRVGAVGAGMLLIHRDVLAKTQPGPFDRIGKLGEDLSFCRRLADLDIPIHVHTGLRTSHTKTVPLT